MKPWDDDWAGSKEDEEKFWDSLKPSDWYFGINEENSSDGIVEATIVPKEFWETYNDFMDVCESTWFRHIEKAGLEDKIASATEWSADFSGTIEDFRKELIKIGFVENPEVGLEE